jgi:hypothetical protein
MRKLLFVIAALVGFAGVGMAQVPAAQEVNPPAGSLKAAERLAEVMNLKGQMGGGFEALMPMIKGMADSMMLAPDERAALESTFRQWYLEDFDHAKILTETVKLYASTFTEEELIVLAEFYTTPAGRKALTVMPELMKRSVVMAAAESRAKQEQLKVRLDRLFTEKVSLALEPKAGQRGN